MFRPTKVIDNNCKTPVRMAEESNQNIQVFVRCRPLNVNEKKGLVDVINEKRVIKTSHQQSSKLYTFDNVFDAKASQIDVYRSVVEPLVEQVIEGYNCTVFAYGQTGTGKTYTMIGNRSDNDVSWEEDPTSGIIPRAIDQLLEDLQSQDTEYTVRVSFLELYNEDAYDLLSPLSDTNKLRIYNDTERKGSVIISGLVELIVKTKDEIFEILKKGTLKRQTAPTLMNACSSRSHSIFSITVHIKEVTLDGEEVVKMGKLNLVDLAGSENIGRSGAVEERAREASNINKSLLTLGRVITSLVEKSSHIPYRDSKLTRLLQDSLGGKTKTSIIATISPGSDDFEDTVSTLDYAQRAKKITNKPEINLKMSKKTLISEYLGEIDKLRRDLEAARDKKGIYVDAKNYNEMQETLKTQEQALEAKEVRIDHLIQELSKCSNLLTETTEGFNMKCEELESTKKSLDDVMESLKQAGQELSKVKQEIQEHRILLEAHQSTEKRLHNEANSIMQVADRCINDNDFLYKKIDTFTQNEDNNLQQLHRFKDEYNEKVAQLDVINSVILKRFNDSHKAIENLVQANKADIIIQDETIRANMSTIHNRIDHFESDFLEILSKEKLATEMSAGLKEMFSKFKKSLTDEFSMNAAVLSEKQSRSNALLEDLRKISLRNHSEIEELVLNQINKVNDLSKHAISAIQLIENDFNQAYESKCLQNRQYADEIGALRNALNSTNFDKRLKAIMDSVQELSQDYCSSNTSFANGLNGLEAKIQDNHMNETNFKDSILFKSNEFLQLFKDEQKAFTSALTNFDLHNNQHCQQIVDKCQEIGSIQQELVSEYDSMKEKSIANVDEVSVELQSKVDAFNDYILVSTNNQEKNLNTFKVDISEHLIANNTLLDLLNSQIDKSFEDTLKECEKVESSYESLQTTHHIRIDELHSIAHELLENGYKLYEITGQTPKKCVYSYPRTLSTTSPHERIIERFRAKVWQELSTSNLTFENETNSISSYDSDKDNTENNNQENCQDQSDKISILQTTFTKGNLPEVGVIRRKFLREKNSGNHI